MFSAHRARHKKVYERSSSKEELFLAADVCRAAYGVEFLAVANGGAVKLKSDISHTGNTKKNIGFSAGGAQTSEEGGFSAEIAGYTGGIEKPCGHGNGIKPPFVVSVFR
jgi:hypothetical protein